MTDFSSTLEELRRTLGAAVEASLDYLPWLLAGLALLVIGWRVARLVRRGTERLGDGLNGLFGRVGRRKSRRRLQVSPAILTLIGNVAFWLVILLTIALAARVAQLDAFTAWFDRVVGYLPTLLAGGLILLAGYLVSTLARDVVSAALDSAGSGQSEFFGLVAQSAIFLAALVIGLDQIGVDVTMLTILFGVIAGGLLLSLALAFGLGARGFVGNLIGAHQVRQDLQPGQHARIGEHDGTVVELTSTAVILATREGRVTIPARLFQEQAVVVYTAVDDDR